MIDEADHDGEGEADEEEILRIMEKIALRGPSPTGTPRPTAGIKVGSPPKRGCTPPNLVDDHSGVDHSPHAGEAGCGVPFGEVPGPHQLQLGAQGDGGVLPTPPCPYTQADDRLEQAGLEQSNDASREHDRQEAELVKHKVHSAINGVRGRKEGRRKRRRNRCPERGSGVLWWRPNKRISELWVRQSPPRAPKPQECLLTRVTDLWTL